MESLGLPSGFRDILFEEAKKRRRMGNTLAGIFERRGYREVTPSGVELMELYARGNQSIRDRVYRFLDRDDNLLALRADFTPAVARIACTRLSSVDVPLKMWYMGNVFRKVSPKQGRFAEISQVGAELLGVDAAAGDAEIIATALECLSGLGVHDVQVHLNHAGIFRGIVEVMDLDRVALSQVREEVDRKDTRALAARLEHLDVRGDVGDQLRALTRFIGGDEVLTSALAVLSNPVSSSALGELRQIGELLHTWKKHISYDFTEIDEMEYYTGVMFRFYSTRLRSELGGGGRYDSLTKEFGRAMPAVGFSFSVEQLLDLVE